MGNTNKINNMTKKNSMFLAAFILSVMPLSILAGEVSGIEREGLAVSYNDSSDTSSEDMKSGVFSTNQYIWDKKNKERIEVWTLAIFHKDGNNFNDLRIIIITIRKGVAGYPERSEAHEFHLGKVKGPVFNKNLEIVLTDSRRPLWNVKEYPKGVLVCRLKLCFNVNDGPSKERSICKYKIKYRKMKDKYKNRIHVNCHKGYGVEYDSRGNVIYFDSEGKPHKRE